VGLKDPQQEVTRYRQRTDAGLQDSQQQRTGDASDTDWSADDIIIERGDTQMLATSCDSTHLQRKASVTADTHGRHSSAYGPSRGGEVCNAQRTCDLTGPSTDNEGVYSRRQHAGASDNQQTVRADVHRSSGDAYLLTRNEDVGADDQNYAIGYVDGNYDVIDYVDVPAGGNRKRQLIGSDVNVEEVSTRNTSAYTDSQQQCVRPAIVSTKTGSMSTKDIGASNIVSTHTILKETQPTYVCSTYAEVGSTKSILNANDLPDRISTTAEPIQPDATRQRTISSSYGNAYRSDLKLESAALTVTTAGNPRKTVYFQEPYPDASYDQQGYSTEVNIG